MGGKRKNSMAIWKSRSAGIEPGAYSNLRAQHQNDGVLDLNPSAPEFVAKSKIRSKIVAKPWLVLETHEVHRLKMKIMMIFMRIFQKIKNVPEINQNYTKRFILPCTFKINNQNIQTHQNKLGSKRIISTCQIFNHP